MSRLLVLFVASVASTFATKVKQQLTPNHPVSIKLADGTTREFTAAEYEALTKKRAQEHATLVTQGTDGLVKHEHTLAAIREQDPHFALQIDLAKGAFQEIQRHGYAQGYLLVGFTEHTRQQASTTPLDVHHVELELHATKDPSSTVPARTGTGTRKQEQEGVETPLCYEVQLLLDAEKRLSVVAAWELSAKEPRRGQRKQRVVQLSIQPTVAMLERKATQNLAKSAVATWLLAGGMTMMVVGVLVVYHTRNPILVARPRRRSSEIWELVDENDTPIRVSKRIEDLGNVNSGDKKKD